MALLAAAVSSLLLIALAVSLVLALDAVSVQVEASATAVGVGIGVSVGAYITLYVLLIDRFARVRGGRAPQVAVAAGLGLLFALLPYGVTSAKDVWSATFGANDAEPISHLAATLDVLFITRAPLASVPGSGVPPSPWLPDLDPRYAVARPSDPAGRIILPFTPDPKTVMAALESEGSGNEPAALEWRLLSDKVVVLNVDGIPITELPPPSTSPGIPGGAPADWEATLARLRPNGASLYILLRDTNNERVEAWRSWAEENGASALTDVNTAGVTLLDRVVGISAGQPTDVERELAWRHRPLLFFDTKEPYRPLNVDQFLQERRDGRPKHAQCRRRPLFGDPCLMLDSARSLDPSYDYIDVDGDARGGTDARIDLSPPRTARRPPEGIPPPPDAPIPGSAPVGGIPFPTTPGGREVEGTPASRIYYQVKRKEGRLFLDYWWFYRFNISPVASEANCIPGLSLTDATCFDHEGDWEGVTVVLKNTPSGYEAEGVHYSGHSWVYAYEWSELAAVGSVTRARPHVYVAFGSHASYPVKCGRSLRRLCVQGDFRVLYGLLPVPEGPSDGAKEWGMNGDVCATVACLAPLPKTASGAASWNAFPGLWGREACWVVPSACVRSHGPESPSFQQRYEHPWKATPARIQAQFKRR